jgi:Domain of unknown function (DUF222)
MPQPPPPERGPAEEPARGTGLPGGSGDVSGGRRQTPGGARDPRLAGFVEGGPGDTCPPSAALARVVDDLSGPERRCDGATDEELVGLLGRWGTLESWAAAGKLAAVRELIRRRARPGLGSYPPPAHGDLPDQWHEGLAHEVSAALGLSIRGADNLTCFAWDLQARLPGVGAALANGTISEWKAKLISDALAPLDDQQAAEAEKLILDQVTGQPPGIIGKLAAQAACTVDPDGAARRREHAEREEARVRFWRDNGGACALAAYGLPTDQALAANDAIETRARRYKQLKVRPDARLDQLRVLAFLDILNSITVEARLAQARADAAAQGPAGPGQSDAPCSGNPADTTGHGGDRDGNGDHDPAGAVDPGVPDDGWDACDWDAYFGDRGEPDDRPDNYVSDHGEPDGGAPGDHVSGNGEPDVDRPGNHAAGEPDGDAPAGHVSGNGEPDGDRPGNHAAGEPYGDAPAGHVSGTGEPAASGPGGAGNGGSAGPGGDRGASGRDDPAGAPGPGVPDDDWFTGHPGDSGDGAGGAGNNSGPGSPGGNPGGSSGNGGGTAGGSAAAPAGPALAARANLTLPLTTLLGLAERPGTGHGLGPLDPALVRDLAASAATSPDSDWCVTITDTEGVAVAHGCARPARTRKTPTPAASRDGPPGGTPWALTRRQEPGPPGGYGSWTLTMPGGRELVLKLLAVPVTDCDHRHQSRGYQPSDTLRHLVQVRDGTCTFPTCSAHARDSDFEHAVPYDQGGKTCACNGGARSRRCHRVKQSPGWSVTQPEPGLHQWTTPSGRTYTQGPMKYPI